MLSELGPTAPASDFKNLLSLDVGREQRAKDKIEIHQKNSDDLPESTQPLLEQLQTEKVKTTNAKQVMLEELANYDGSIKQQLNSRTDLAASLSTHLIEPDSPQFVVTIAEELGFYAKKCPERQCEIISRIERDFRKNNQLRARKIIAELIQDLNSIELQWKDVISHTELSLELLENIDNVILNIRVRNSLQIIDQQAGQLSKSELIKLRTKIFADLTSQGYSYELVLDLIEGRYDLEDPTWNGNIIASFLPIHEFIITHEKQKTSSLKTKIILTGIVTMLAAGMIFAANHKSPPPSQPNRSAAGLVTPPPMTGSGSLPDDIAQTGYGDAKSGGSGESGVNADGSSGEAGATGGDSNSADSADVAPHDAEAPPPVKDTYSPENSGEGMNKAIYWQIEGTVPDGFYREAIGQNFIFNQWTMDTSSDRVWQQFLPSTPVDSPSKLVSVFPISEAGQRFSIPVPSGWELTYVQVGSMSDSVIDVFMSQNGSYVAELSVDLPTPQTLTVGMKPIEIGKHNSYDSPVTTDPDRGTIDIRGLMGNPENQDQQAIAFLNKIRDDSSLSPAEKTVQVTNFVRDHFVYSLEPKYSDFYLADRSEGEFIKRAWQVGFGDCDVVNTVNIAFLRYIGIDAREAIGFANDSALLSINRKTLEGSEKHGWAQFFNPITNTWEDADATPGLVDPSSAEQLRGLNGGAGIEQLANIKSIQDLLRTFKLPLAKMAEFATSEWGILAEILSLITIYSLIYGLGRRAQRKNNQLLEKLETYLNERSGVYWKPEARIAEKVGSIVHDIFHAKSNYIGHGDDISFFDRALLIPRLLKAKQDRKLIEPLKKSLQQTQDFQPSSLNEPIPNFVARVSGIDVADVVKQNQDEHFKISLYNIRHNFNRSLNSAFAKDLLGSTLYDLNLNKIFLRNPTNEALFIHEVFDYLYESYLRTLSRANKKKARLLKHPKRSSEAAPTILPIEQPIRVFVTPKPITKIEMIKALSLEIPLLLKYHEVAKMKPKDQPNVEEINQT